MRFGPALFLLVLIGCSGEAPTDSDPIRTDAKTESSSDDTGEGDTGGESDTGSANDTGSTGETSGDATPDTRPTCTEVEAEPNNSIPSAVALKEIDDCDGSGGTLKGMVAGGTDPDFFHYKGNDKFGCVVDATASTKTAGVRLCVFVSCASGTTELKSCKKGMKETSPGGVLGCCSSGPGEVVVEHGCPLVGSSDSADVYIRVDAPGSGSMCTPYDVDYHF
jgi:hypothetical protein